MIDTIKAFFTKDWWIRNWKKAAAVFAWGAIWYVIGACTGARIQSLIDKI